MYARSFFQRLFHKQLPPVIKTFNFSVACDQYCLWIGHSTFLIHLNGCTILTDPVFGAATWLFKRICRPGAEVGQLPPVDYVLLSHNHRDHMDADSIFALIRQNPQVTFLVPLETKKWFLQHGIKRVHEYVWWDAFEIPGLRCTFLPAYHWSGRFLTDRNRTLWGSWMIEGQGKTIYFAGDTAYWKHFSCIAHYFPHIDVALLPVGPCTPYSYMRTSHLNATWAVQAFCDLRARNFVAMHWGTFYFGTDDIYTPLPLLKQAWRAKKLTEERLIILNPGHAVNLVTGRVLAPEKSANITLKTFL